MKIQHIWMEELHSYKLNSATSGQLAATETTRQLEEAPWNVGCGKGETEERREEEGTDFPPVN